MNVHIHSPWSNPIGELHGSAVCDPLVCESCTTQPSHSPTGWVSRSPTLVSNGHARRSNMRPRVKRNSIFVAGVSSSSSSPKVQERNYRPNNLCQAHTENTAAIIKPSSISAVLPKDFHSSSCKKKLLQFFLWLCERATMLLLNECVKIMLRGGRK
jgi:hypothetical protein